MQPHPERVRIEAHELGRLNGREPEEVDQHEGFTVMQRELPERPLEVDPLVVIALGRRGIRLLKPPGSLEEPVPASLQEYPTGDPEEPMADRPVTAVPKGGSAGTEERLLGELLRVVAVPNDPQEVGEDGALVLAEDIFKLHGMFPSSPR